MATRICIYGLLGVIIILVGAAGVSGDPKGTTGAIDSTDVPTRNFPSDKLSPRNATSLVGDELGKWSEPAELALEPQNPKDEEPLELTPDIQFPDYLYAWNPWEERVLVTAPDSESRPVIIKDVVAAGFYKFQVEAGYSNLKFGQDKEEYCLWINGEQRGDIIPDQYTPSEEDSGHTWRWIDHGYQKLNEGDNTIVFHKGNQTEPPNSVHFRTIKITCKPYLLPEPRYTPGLSNTVCWIPTSAHDHEVVCFDSVTGSSRKPLLQLQRPLVSDTICATFEDLDDGHTYVYYVEARWLDGRIVRSDSVFSTQDASPPTEVKIDSLRAFWSEFVDIYWRRTYDSISGVEYYRICRRTLNATKVIIDTVPDTTSYYCYQDTLPDPNESYNYQIYAVDSVGNEGEGEWSGTVVLLPPPEIWICQSTYHAPDLTHYVKGTEATICAKVTGGGLHKPDFVKFQAVRDSIKFFDSQWHPGEQFFTSGWLPIEQFALDSIHYTFDFSNAGTNQPNFINGHTYLYRVQTKDLVGNSSQWSRIDSQGREIETVQDLFPAEDVRNLMIDVVKGTNATNSYMLIRWDATNDAVSGLKEYLVFRKKGGGGVYEMIVTVSAQTGPPQVSYQDSFANIDTSATIYYRIGSMDQVGNRRDFDNCVWEVGARCLLGPKVILQAETKRIGGILFTTQTRVILDWSGYDLANVVGFVVLVNGSEMQVDASTSQVQVDIQEEANQFVVKALFDDGRESLWSDVLQVWRDTTPPPPVAWVEVENDPGGYQGNMYVHWSPSIDPAKVFYRIYREEVDGSEPILYATTSDTFWTDYYEEKLLKVYQTYKYIVYPVDSLGNAQTTGMWDSNYCNKPPIITHLAFDQEYSKLSITCHTPPYPDSSAVALQNLRFDVKCFQDSLPADFAAHSPYRSQSVVGDTTMWFNVEPNHDYHCTLRGVELRSGRYDSTHWTKPRLVETKLETDIPPVTELHLQSQPTDTTGIFVSWESYWQHDYWTTHKEETVDFFRVIRTSTTDALIRDFTPSSVTFTTAQFMDRENLVPLAEYAYQIIPFEVTQNEPPDSLFPEVNVTVSVINDTDRVFIPQVDLNHFSFHPQQGKYYFRSEGHSIRVEWRWLDSQGVVIDTSTHNTRGAHTVQIEVANNSDFLLDPSTGKYTEVKNIIMDPSSWSEDTGFYHTYFHELNLPQKFNIYDGNMMFLKIKALDRWGHDPNYPSSVKWDGVVEVILDDTPPTQTSLVASSRAVTSPDSNKVDLLLSWESAVDLVSGVRTYKIFLDSLVNNNYIAIDSLVNIPPTARDTSFSSIPISNLFTAALRLRIVTEDWARNQQWNNAQACLEILPAPQLLGIEINDDSTVTATWTEIPGSEEYYIEYVDSLQFLGNLALRLSPENHRFATDTSYTWAKDYFGNKRYYFHVAAISPTNNESGWFNVDSLEGLPPGEGSLISDVDEKSQIPSKFQLCQNYPNPFNAETTIEYHLPSARHVAIRIYNTLGKVVRILVDEQKEAGIHLVHWNGQNELGQGVASGIYFYMMHAGRYQAIKKTLLLK